LLGLAKKPFWQDESYDRLIRGEKEFERALLGFRGLKPAAG
jgi:hypothetical protein